MSELTTIISILAPFVAIAAIWVSIEKRLTTIETKQDWLINWVACLNGKSKTPLSDSDLAKIAFTREEVHDCTKNCMDKK